MRDNPDLSRRLWPWIYPLFHRDAIYAGTEYADRRSAFRTIFDEKRWGEGESVSGGGSSLRQTAFLRRRLSDLLEEKAVATLLDAPCGDFHWMRHVALPDRTRYLGGDIVEPLIEGLRVTDRDERHDFVVLDIVEGPLPPADLWLCRDVLFHLSNADVLSVLSNLSRSRIEWFLVDTSPFQRVNHDIRSGGFRFVNLERPPFRLPRPALRLPDFDAPEPPSFLCLWHRDAVTAALDRPAG